MSIIKQKILGSTKIKITPIGLGAGKGYQKSDSKHQRHLIKVIQTALDLGVNFIDTAEIYADGHSEETIGQALKRVRPKVIIATKFSPEHNSHQGILKSVEGSLKRLKTDYIDLYQIHWPNPVVPLEETISTLKELIKQGKICHVGICNFSFKQLKKARKLLGQNQLVSLQTEYNFLDRTVEDKILPFCQRQKITLIAYAPLNSGEIVRNERIKKVLTEIANCYQKTVTQIGLNWLICHQSVVAIPGTTNLDHLKSNIESVNFILKPQDRKLIDELFKPKITQLPTNTIKVNPSVDEKIYKTIEEAIVNRFNFFPSPVALAQEIIEGEFLKPIRVRSFDKPEGSTKYELISGKLRYWAWVIAYQGKKSISAIIE